ncbi:MAG: FAD-dependent oxidoreductase [Bdellovibrionia bacterium]
MTKQTKSIWIGTSPSSIYGPLKGKEKVDVIVIGAGMTGISVALQLKLAGKTVAVIDQHSIGTGESGHTTAHITEILDSQYQKIQSDFGKKSATLVARAMQAANEQIARWVEEWNIDCSYEKVPAFQYTESRKDIRSLKKELAAFQKVGLTAKWQQTIPLPFETYGGIRIEDQAQFHPRKYLLALAKRIPGDGSHIFENTRALEIKEGTPAHVVTEQGELFGQDLVVATNTPSVNRFFMHTKVAAYRTYAIASPLDRPPLTKGLYWDTADPYHYIRSYDEVWIIGGEDHKTGMKTDTEECYLRLAEYTRSHFSGKSITDKWSGQIMDPVDGLPYIGLNPASRHTYIATGFSGNGMTFGTLSGLLIPDLILKRDNPWAEIFSPKRINVVSSAMHFLAENKDYPVCLIKDHLLKTNTSKPEDVSNLPAGEGCVVNQNGQSIAVYRDKKSELHTVSAVCTHLGCQVHWNSSEKSWDCPCHGSRFSTEGEVLNGPATVGLHPVQYVAPQKDLKKSAA